MKDSIKILVLFVVLSVGFSGLIGCSNAGSMQSGTGNAPSNNNGQGAASGVNSVSTGKATNSDYPEVPASIMQADLEALDGSKFKLEDKKGKIVLINLWGIWCIPCIKEMPHLIEMQDMYKEKGFEIIGLNIGDENLEKESAENIKKFSEKMKLNYQLGWAEDKIYKDFLDVSKFGGVPQSFLIDREGRLNGIYLGGSPATIAKLKQNLATLTAAN
jgi:thiol-disulfide isomerase/thioredoxin